MSKTKTISLRLSESLLDRIKIEANKRYALSVADQGLVG